MPLLLLSLVAHLLLQPPPGRRFILEKDWRPSAPLKLFVYTPFDAPSFSGKKDKSAIYEAGQIRKTLTKRTATGYYSQWFELAPDRESSEVVLEVTHYERRFVEIGYQDNYVLSGRITVPGCMEAEPATAFAVERRAKELHRMMLNEVADAMKRKCSGTLTDRTRSRP